MSLPTNPLEVLAYYFPQWHRDSTNDAIHGPGWTEWSLLQAATPRFAGHQQPKRPAWGYVDEATPEHASRVVDAALAHGLNGFIVDWYWFDNGPFLNRALDEGLLHADRFDEFRFALMWANHEWSDLYPATDTHPAVLLPAPNSRYHARCAFRHVIERYLHHPSYWSIGGAPYFSIYDLPSFVQGMGGLSAAADVLAGFRENAAREGIGVLHLNGVATFQISDPAGLAVALGLDSMTHYTWWHHPNAGFDTFPTTPYARAQDRARDAWLQFDEALPVPYIPNVTVGWDPTPRAVEWAMDRELGYPFTSVLVDNTPANVGAALTDALRHVSVRDAHRVVTINAWNEWTEGSYLEPDEHEGYAYLEQIRSAIALARTESHQRTAR